MATRYVMQRHTMAWRLHIWVSFILSVLACAIGAVYMPSQEVDTAFLVIGLVFCVFTSFAVAKTIRDNRDGPNDASIWVMTVWASFLAAMCLMAWGLWSLNIQPWHRGFMVVSWLYLVSSAVSVAKMMRDQFEASLIERDANITSQP
jgi:hypothetical protein